MDGTLVSSLVATYSVVVMAIMQLGLKTLLEQLPFMKPVDGAVHDAVLRLVVLALNAGLIVATALTTPAFTGLAWYDLLALAFGQAVISHGVFTVASSGGTGGSSAAAPIVPALSINMDGRRLASTAPNSAPAVDMGAAPAQPPAPPAPQA